MSLNYDPRGWTMCNATEVIHANPLWEYEDGRGVITRGHFERFSDRGGSDVTYFFRSCEDGTLSVVSGSRLQRARRIWEPCPLVS